MRGKKGIIGAALCIAASLCLLWPLAGMLDKESRGKGEMIAQMLVRQHEHEHQAPGVPVEGMIELEDAWAIEDTREPAANCLVEIMHNGGSELGFDRESRTFYCTLGMDYGDDEWPEISLSARGGEPVRVAWIDDYSYDYRSDAVRDGYAYELIAYTDSEYEYIYVVFTGLPLVTLHVDSEVGEEYVPSRVSIAGQGYAPVDSAALVHTRGGGYRKSADKPSYRIEFHDEEGRGLEKKSDVSVLGMQADSDWLLLSNAQDVTAVRNYLAYDLWERWNPDGDALMMMDNRMVELFVNDEYMGIYQLMERLDEEEEILRAGGDLQTSCVTRLVMDMNVGEKPWVNLMERILMYAEYRYAPGNNVRMAFDHMEDFVVLNHYREGEMLSDAEFEALALRRVDIDAYISYYLFVQGCGTCDNLANNLYIWMLAGEDGEYRYYHSPWDMDTAVTVSQIREDGSQEPYFEMGMQLPQRLLNLDVGGSRGKIHALWNEKRSTILTDDAIYAWIKGVEEEINASGAYLRESEKWRGGAQELILSELIYSHLEHMDTIQWHLDELWPVQEGAL